MDLNDYVDALRSSLTTAAAAAGEQARETARLLADTIEPAVRLALIDAMSAVAEEVTAALDGSLVDIRVRGRDPEVVVVPATSTPDEELGPEDVSVDDDAAVSRISLRLPDPLKARAERSAAAEGLSLNAWLVRAVAAAVRQTPGGPKPGRGPRHWSGFARS